MENHVDKQPMDPKDQVKLYYMLEFSHLLLKLLYTDAS